MRTTIRIDDQLYRELKQRANATGRTVGEMIEDAVRASLQERAATVPPPPLPTYRGTGLQPGVDLSDNAALGDAMDDDAPVDALR